MAAIMDATNTKYFFIFIYLLSDVEQAVEAC